MEGLAGLVVAGVVGSLVVILASLRSREKAEAWQRAANAARLTGVEISTLFGFASRLTGQAGGLQVRVGTYRRGKQERGTRVVVGGLRHGAYALTIRSEGFATAIEKTFGERETELGDEAFDRAAYLQGAPGLIRAIFDADTRRLLGPLLEGEWHVAGGDAATKLSVRTHVSDSELQVDIKEPAFGNVLARLPEALSAIVDLARRLTRPDDLAVAIAANTRNEPLAAVRLGNVQLLAREHGAHAATRQTLLAALTDPEPAVKLQAAMALGPDGRATLLACASGEDVSDGIAARAIDALGQDFDTGAAIVRLRRARDAGERQTGRACIGVIARAGTSEAIEALAAVVANGPDALAAMAASGLGAAPNGAAERALVLALGRDAAAVRVAAAESLGRIGTPVAVASLRECASAHIFDGALRKATREAIAEIQARVGGASPGQLSLAVESTGEVTLVDEDRRGEVSLEPANAEPQAKG